MSAGESPRTHPVNLRAPFLLACVAASLLAPGPCAARSLEQIRATGELRICVAGSSAAFYRRNAEIFARELGLRPQVTALAAWDDQFRDARGEVDREARYVPEAMASGRCDLYPNDLHIVPWREDKANWLNPSNGLCLSAIHDKAFDNHMFSLTDDARIVLSQPLKASKDTFVRDIFWPAEDQLIELPERFAPDRTFIARHRNITLAQSNDVQ